MFHTTAGNWLMRMEMKWKYCQAQENTMENLTTFRPLWISHVNLLLRTAAVWTMRQDQKSGAGGLNHHKSGWLPAVLSSAK
jgi:hypothetical protein